MPPADAVHIPILTGEILSLLELQPGDRWIDATVDGGGHAGAMLAATAPDGKLLGIDRDPELLQVAQARLAAEVDAGRAVLRLGNFRELGEIAGAAGFGPVSAVLFDLGVSSYHFDRSGRGFAFAHNEPLDMRFDGSGDSAADVLAQASLEELRHIFRDYGEERFAHRIAVGVTRRRESEPIRDSATLLDVIRAALPRNIRWQANRSAARIFQALRIAVNDEIEAVREAVPQAFELLAPGGRLAVLSFHSLEDRIIKQYLVSLAQSGQAKVLTKKPLRATEAEIDANPRAGSAKLRVCQKL
ncbi:MAG TPA: 16S rRNA (cytosine(1402)-N(4))-methyltransferase RsmH [Terriglobales bacterium]|nr:16S rRNA (cytosine(1402)-N(4))-methyltransferase RsmH [Terriglobales bacterium]